MYYGDLVGSLVDPLAAELVFLPETVVGLTAQGYDSITTVLFFKQPWCSLIVGCMLWSVCTWKPVLLPAYKMFRWHLLHYALKVEGVSVVSNDFLADLQLLVVCGSL
jgi:hypothetical protein